MTHTQKKRWIDRIICILLHVLKYINNVYQYICLFSDEEPEKPTFDKRDLSWEDDMEMYSKFLDRKVRNKWILNVGKQKLQYDQGMLLF